MSYRSWIAAALLAACLFINPSSAIAQMPVSGVYWPQTPATMKAEHRAGYSQSVSPIAMESYNEHYSGGYIGGGTLFGRPRPYLPGRDLGLGLLSSSLYVAATLSRMVARPPLSGRHRLLQDRWSQANRTRQGNHPRTFLGWRINLPETSLSSQINRTR